MKNLKTKALAMGLAASLAMGLAVAPSATALAGTDTATGTGAVGSGVTVKGYQDTTYDVTVTWGEMTFHYSNASSTWIPMANKNDNTTDVHKDANKLMVTNNSNVSVTGTFTYTPASGVSGVTESFYGLSNGATGSIASGAAKTTYLDLSGKPTGLGSYDYDNAMKIGTVTLTLN